MKPKLNKKKKMKEFYVQIQKIKLEIMKTTEETKSSNKSVRIKSI